jgi:hypothetical protein
MKVAAVYYNAPIVQFVNKLVVPQRFQSAAPGHDLV